MAQPTRRTVSVADPSALRALAHPLRLQIIGALREEGPQTVGALSDRLDAAPGSISYHLGTLERHGLVEQASDLARDGRESWWRASAELTTFDPVALRRNPAQRTAARAMRRAFVQGYAADQLSYLEHEDELDEDWVAASTISDDGAWLTADELNELSRELEDLAARGHARGDRERAGTARVRIVYSAYRRP